MDGVALMDDEELWTILSSQDPDPTHWAKGTTLMFPNAPNEFQIHFYWHKPSNTIRFDVDFKLRFRYVFEP